MFNLKVCVHVTEQREGVASGAQLLGVVHTVDNWAAALSCVQEVVCTAWVQRQREQMNLENMQYVQFKTEQLGHSCAVGASPYLCGDALRKKTKKSCFLFQ